MSGQNGMQGGMQMPPNPMQPQPAQMPGMMAPAMPQAQQGGQMPAGMAPNPYQYGAPNTSQYVQQQSMQRMPNKF